MSIIEKFLNLRSATLINFKKYPSDIIQSSKGLPVRVKNEGETIFYAIPAETYESFLHMLEDWEIKELIESKMPSDNNLIKGDNA